MEYRRPRKGFRTFRDSVGAAEYIILSPRLQYKSEYDGKKPPEHPRTMKNMERPTGPLRHVPRIHRLTSVFRCPSHNEIPRRQLPDARISRVRRRAPLRRLRANSASYSQSSHSSRRRKRGIRLWIRVTSPSAAAVRIACRLPGSMHGRFPDPSFSPVKASADAPVRPRNSSFRGSGMAAEEKQAYTPHISSTRWTFPSRTKVRPFLCPFRAFPSSE